MQMLFNNVQSSMATIEHYLGVWLQDCFGRNLDMLVCQFLDNFDYKLLQSVAVISTVQWQCGEGLDKKKRSVKRR